MGFANARSETNIILTILTSPLSHLLICTMTSNNYNNVHRDNNSVDASDNFQLTGLPTV